MRHKKSIPECDQAKRMREEHERKLKQKALERLDGARRNRDSRLRFCAPAKMITGSSLFVRTGQFVKWLGVTGLSVLLWAAYGAMILYRKLDITYPLLIEFILFWMISNLVTLFQLVGMPVLKSLFSSTRLIEMSFQILRVGTNLDGSPYYIFDYEAGLLSDGGGGGLAYFLAVLIVLFFAQVLNFPLQRNIVFKSKGNPWLQAPWFFLAFVAITLFAGAAQGLYKVPLYNLLIVTWKMGNAGEAAADVVSMFIYAIISFWIYFPILKIIFPRKARSGVSGSRLSDS